MGSMARIADKVAYATLYCTRLACETDADPYFSAVQLLIYQLLHRPSTRTQFEIPVLVLVPPHVSEARRSKLRSMGASVIDIDYVRWTGDWIRPRRERWIDQLCKLRLFEQVAYDRILYLDADILLLKPLDGIWSEPVANQRCLTRPSEAALEDNCADPSAAMRLPDTYLFVGVPETYGSRKPDPPIPFLPESLNGGFWLASPSLAMFRYYTSLLSIPNSFDSQYMEQGLFRFAHRDSGRMPWTKFEPKKWSVNRPRVDDLYCGAAALHERFWINDKPWVEPELHRLWNEAVGELLLFHRGARI